MRLDFQLRVKRFAVPIIEKTVNSLDEFWEILSPIGEFMSRLANPVFRGQGRSDWPLTPAVLREDIVRKYQNERSVYAQTDHIYRFEYGLLSDFLYYFDELGFVIPNDSTEFRAAMDHENFTDRYGADGLGWPSKEYFSFIALAQHHGIPTRLLDWTRSPFVAAYFAASQALSLTAQAEKIAVWVIDLRDIDRLKDKLDLVRVPGSTSVNLAAQKGVFLVFRQQGGMGRSSPFLFEDMKNSVNDLLVENEDCCAYKVTLPSCLSGELLIRCAKFGFSAATLFPGFDGAARAALEFKMATKQAGLL